jgi:hypothetical protein
VIDTGSVIVDVLDGFRFLSDQQVGDGIRPDGVGWLNGEPNAGVFVPYSVVTVAGATTRDMPLPYEETIKSWQVTFRLTHYGASRAQADFVATKVRGAVSGFMRQSAGGYQVTGARWAGLGAMTRDDSINPPLWSASDTLILMLDS